MGYYGLAKIIGHLPFAFRGRHRLVSALYPEGGKPRIQRVARIKGSRRSIHADSNQHIGWHVLVYGCYEGNLLRTMKRLLKGFSLRVAIDVGANIGHHTLVLSNLFKRVYSFEPIPEFREVLAANLYLNNIDNVEIIPLALGRSYNRAQMALLFHHNEPQTASVNTGAYSFEDPFRWEVRETEMNSLDHFVRSRGLTDVDYLKVDTDGSEEDILQGAADTLIRFQPLIQVELTEDAKQWRRDLSLPNLVRFLKQFGYEMLDSNGRPHGSATFNGNYFALPKRMIK